MFPTPGGMTEYGGRLSIAIKPKQAKYGTGTTADDIQLFVRGNKIVGKQIRRDMRIRKQLIVTQAFRHDC